MSLNLSAKEQLTLKDYKDSPSRSRSGSGSGGRTRSSTWEGTDDHEKKIQRGRIFVGRVPHNCTPHIIEEHFSQFGVVKRVDWPMVFDENLGIERHQGYCFVTFESDAGTSRALEQDIHPLEKLDNREVYVEPSLQPKKKQAPRPKQDNPERTIWIGGVHHECIPEEIEAHFVQYGRVTAIKWPMRFDKKLGMDRHKGFCTLTFEDATSVHEAVANSPFCMDKYPGHNMRCTKLNEGYKKNTKPARNICQPVNSSLPKSQQMCKYGDQCYFGLCPFKHVSGNDRPGLDELKRRRKEKRLSRQNSSGKRDISRPKRAFSSDTSRRTTSFRDMSIRDRAMTVPASATKPVASKDETPLINDALAWRVMPRKTTDQVKFTRRAKSIGTSREKYGPGWTSSTSEKESNGFARC